MILNSERKKENEIESNKESSGPFADLNTEPEQTNVALKEREEKGRKTVSTENNTSNINASGIDRMPAHIRNEQNKGVEKFDRFVESKRLLTLASEATSLQTNLLDSSARLLFERLQDLNKPLTDENGDRIRNPSVVDIECSVKLAETINELMKTKREAFKTTADIMVRFNRESKL